MINTVSKIESMGIYCPPKKVSTEEVMAACRRRPRWDIDKLTGIAERRFAEGEYASDLAIKAAQRALSGSRYSASDLDLVICTSISKYNRPGEVQFEPATASLIVKSMGAGKAQTFDVVNACAGMFTGIAILDAYIASGAVRCGMVVSGEHNLPLVQTAQKEIRHSLDRQLAALTLGDCGAAIILDRRDNAQHGFHKFESVSGAKHNHYCYSTPSKKGPGGILITKAVGLQRKGAEHFPTYLKKIVEATGWTMEDVDCAIPHQVSVRAIRRGIKEVRNYMRAEVPNRYISIAERYGNTTTTSHFLALHEKILDGSINPGSNVLFISGASGIVITHATYTMDDLAQRYRAANAMSQGTDNA